MTNFSKEKKDKNKKRSKLSFKIINRMMFLFIIVLGVYYVAGINDLTVKGFKLQELKIGSIETADENKDLELKIMSFESYNRLSEKIKELDMVAVGNVEYISGPDSVVAKK